MRSLVAVLSVFFLVVTAGTAGAESHNGPYPALKEAVLWQKAYTERNVLIALHAERFAFDFVGEEDDPSLSDIEMRLRRVYRSRTAYLILRALDDSCLERAFLGAAKLGVTLAADTAFGVERRYGRVTVLIDINADARDIATFLVGHTGLSPCITNRLGIL